MKYFYNVKTDSFFGIDNFEYDPKDNEYEITEDALNEYKLKVKQGYIASYAVENGNLKFVFMEA